MAVQFLSVCGRYAEKEIYAASLMDKNQFIVNGCLNMRLILEKFVVHFHDLYGDQNETFLEEEGRKYFCFIYVRSLMALEIIILKHRQEDRNAQM